jgi:hypothetical protein
MGCIDERLMKGTLFGEDKAASVSARRRTAKSQRREELEKLAQNYMSR